MGVKENGLVLMCSLVKSELEFLKLFDCGFLGDILVFECL